MDPRALFVPGWGAPASLYSPLLPSDWSALEPPSFAVSNGSLTAYRRWLGRELERHGRGVLGGHSMGGALSLLAAADAPELVERLVLVAPAGMPLQKPIWLSLLSFLRQTAARKYPANATARAAAAALRAPHSALRLALQVRALDLRRECARIRASAIPTLVVGCSSDTLVTSAHARTLAHALGAEYRELQLAGGHMWMLGERERGRERFAHVLAG
jgi:pimeloyl-ACP methyl ester carboxylesterase